MPLPGTRTFTGAAVQRAMDTQASRWGAPPGYYAVMDRVRRLTTGDQVWEVKVRLFGGRTRHLEKVVFTREGGDPAGTVIFARLYAGPVVPREFQVSDLIQPALPMEVIQERRRRVARTNAERRESLQSGTIGDANATFTAWVQSEDRTVREDAANGIPISVTAHTLGRTYYAVSRRRSVLGINTRKKEYR